MTDFFAKVLLIQKEFRDKKICNKNRMDFLESYFEKERQSLINFYILKKSKKAKSNVKKLTAITNELRNKVLQIYFEVSKLKYSIAYNKWRATKQGLIDRGVEEVILKREELIA